MNPTMIPEKYFYSIGDVCRLTGTKPHILRYWESQFKLLRPARRYSGHRKFTKREIDLINKIRYLLIDRKFTLAGAKKEINRQLAGKPPSVQAEPQKQSSPSSNPILLKEIKKEIESCLQIINQDSPQRELIGIK